MRRPEQADRPRDAELLTSTQRLMWRLHATGRLSEHAVSRATLGQGAAAFLLREARESDLDAAKAGRAAAIIGTALARTPGWTGGGETPSPQP